MQSAWAQRSNKNTAIDASGSTVCTNVGLDFSGIKDISELTEMEKYLSNRQMALANGTSVMLLVLFSQKKHRKQPLESDDQLP